MKKAEDDAILKICEQTYDDAMQSNPGDRLDCVKNNVACCNIFNDSSI
jgi:hypothetical protein